MASVDAWVPLSPLRPKAFSLDFNLAFKSSACYLLAGLLHTEPTQEISDDVSKILEGVVTGTCENLTASQRANVVSEYESASLWENSSVAALNTIFIVVKRLQHAAELASDPTAVLDLEGSFVVVSNERRRIEPDDDFDNLVISTLDLVCGTEFDTLQDALPSIVTVEDLWIKYASQSGFAAGRGVDLLFTSFDDQKDVTEAYTPWPAYFRYLVRDFVVYDTARNFSLASIGRAVKNQVGIATKFVEAAAKTVWSNTGDLRTNVHQRALEAATGVMEGVLEGKPIIPTLLTNIARSGIKGVVQATSGEEEKYSNIRGGLLANFVRNKDADNSYNPRIGYGDSRDSTGFAWRIPMDDFGMRLAKLGAKIFSREVGNDLFDHRGSVLTALDKYVDILNKLPAVGRGRAPGQDPETATSSNQVRGVGSYYEAAFRQEQPTLVQMIEQAPTNPALETPAVITAMTYGSHPSAHGVFDAQGEEFDVADARQLARDSAAQEAQIGNLSTQLTTVTRERDTLENTVAALRRRLQTAVATPPAMSGRYANWAQCETDELVTMLNAKWMHLQDAYELVDALNEFNFKYDTGRDSARSRLTGDEFTRVLAVTETVRFPTRETLVCQDSQEIRDAISDVLAALNYRNDEDVRGPKDSSNQAQKVRATTQYNDAALNYVKSVATLSKVFGRNAFTRSKFERKYGLFWQA